VALAREVDEALDRIVAGEARSLGAPPPDGAAALLERARALRSLPRPAADVAARSLARDLFLAEADARRARWVHVHHVPAVAPVPPGKGVQVGQLTALLLALLAAVAVGGVLAVAASFSEPDSGLYAVKRGGENILLTLNRDPVSRSDLEVKLAQERLREAETMASVRKPDLAVEALSARYAELRDGGARLASARSRDSRWTAARSRYLDEANKPITPLQRQLTQKGYPSWATEASREQSAFQKYLDDLMPLLGVKPNPQPSPSPSA
jgi:hypothetical protein